MPRITSAFAELMGRLGTSATALRVAMSAPVLRGCSPALNRTASLAPTSTRPDGVHLLGDEIPIDTSGLSEAEQEHVSACNSLPADAKGYLQIQSTRPQTLAYSLNDSPVGQFAWIVEKFKEWTNPAADLPEDAVDRDQLLTNISIYWFTGTGATAANSLYESYHSEEGWVPPSDVPQGMAGVQQRPDPAPPARPWAEIGHWSSSTRRALRGDGGAEPPDRRYRRTFVIFDNALVERVANGVPRRRNNAEYD